jgi:squalene-hopene/tetraprenyl-beta-curcumene cyclase
MNALILTLSIASLIVSAPANDNADKPPLTFDVRFRAEAAARKGVKFLEASQRPDGSWEAFGKPHVGVSALALKCLLQSPDYGPEHEAAKRGVRYLLQHVRPGGGVYEPDEGLNNYTTSVALMALASTDDPALRQTIGEAQIYLKKLQWDEGEGHEVSSSWYGGAGYGRHKRPDLSNTQMMLEALHESGLPPDDPVYKKAMIFISRSQMLGATNDQPFAQGSDDGGFIYTPANEGESKAGTELDAGRPRLRSYGSMTYAAFKSMLYAQLDRDDERVAKAFDWIRRNYTLDVNPNMPGAQSREGLFYYYHVFARALHAWGEETILDGTNRQRRWRTELCDKLISLQRENGSWVNEADRWFESNPYLVTAYAVLALQTAIDR